MKKILFILAFLPLFAFGQNQKLSELTSLTSINGTEFMYGIRTLTSYKIQSSLFLALIGDTADVVRGEFADTATVLRGLINDIDASTNYWVLRTATTGEDKRTIFPYYNAKTKYVKLYIGADPGTSLNPYYLHVTGDSYFNGDVTAADTIHLGTYTKIWDTGGEIYFENQNNTFSLADLNTFPSSLSEDWDLDIGSYDISLFTTDNEGFYTTNASDLVGVVADGSISLSAPVIDVSDSIYIAGRGDADWMSADTLCIDGDCITAWSEVEGSGGIGGTYVAGSSTGRDTVRLLVNVSIAPQYDGTDTLDRLDLVIDTLSENTYRATATISSAEILAGSNITLVAAPGAGYSIYPLRIRVHLEAGTAYTAGGGTNDVEIGTDFMESISEANLGLNSTNETFTYIHMFNDVGLSGIDPSNKAIVLDLDTHTTGTKAGYIQTWYYVITEE